MGDISEHPQVATLNNLAAKITELAASLTKQIEENNIKPVTLEADSPIKYEKMTGDMFVTRQALDDCLKDMWILSQGPSDSIFNYVHMTIPDVTCLNILNQFDIWNAVPLDGTATYEEIAKKIRLPVEVIQRVVDHAVTQRYFIKTSPTSRSVKHSSRSAALAKDAGLRALVQMVVNDSGPPMFKIPDALRRYSLGKEELSTKIEENAFSLCYSGGAWGNFKSCWDYLENDGEEGASAVEGAADRSKGWRSRNFVTFMAYIKDLFSTEQFVLDAIDWKGAGDITLVDIGGSAGHDDFVLARKYPNLKIVVQDLEEVAPVFDKTVPSDLKDRVSFRIHNMFDAQPIVADVYMFKWIFHDWPDAESVKILQALRPAMKPGARVVFLDYVGKADEAKEGDPELPRSVAAFGSATDLRMMALFSCKERPPSYWKNIFKQADERYDVVREVADPLTFMCTLEVVWRG